MHEGIFKIEMRFGINCFLKHYITLWLFLHSHLTDDPSILIFIRFGDIQHR